MKIQARSVAIRTSTHPFFNLVIISSLLYCEKFPCKTPTIHLSFYTKRTNFFVLHTPRFQFALQLQTLLNRRDKYQNSACFKKGVYIDFEPFPFGFFCIQHFHYLVYVLIRLLPSPIKKTISNIKSTLPISPTIIFTRFVKKLFVKLSILDGRVAENISAVKTIKVGKNFVCQAESGLLLKWLVSLSVSNKKG